MSELKQEFVDSRYLNESTLTVEHRVKHMKVNFGIISLLVNIYVY